MPVPMMLAITMEDAVTKPMVRRGDRDFTGRDSATVIISRSTIPKLSGVANSFEEALESIIGERVCAICWSQWENSRWLRMKTESHLQIFLSCQKSFPASLSKRHESIALD